MALRNPRSSASQKAVTSVTPRNFTASEVAKWFAELDRLKASGFLGKGRKQPVTPRREFHD